jgi:hypothetical protein
MGENSPNLVTLVCTGMFSNCFREDQFLAKTLFVFSPNETKKIAVKKILFTSFRNFSFHAGLPDFS